MLIKELQQDDKTKWKGRIGELRGWLKIKKRERNRFACSTIDLTTETAGSAGANNWFYQNRWKIAAGVGIAVVAVGILIFAPYLAPVLLAF